MLHLRAEGLWKMEYLRIRLQKIDVATLVDFHYIEKILCLHLKSKNFVQALQNNIYFKVLVRILLKCMQLCMYCKVKSNLPGNDVARL